MIARDLCVCPHCDAEFVPTKAQWKKRNERRPYCSDACRSARQREPRKDRLACGPCPTCGQTFSSLRPKVFCTLECYTKSPQLREQVKANSQKAADRLKSKRVAIAMEKGIPIEDVTKEIVHCGECGVQIFLIPSMAMKRKYCSRNCYRAFMAKRFDRWIASPQTIALPQAYDEFLMQDELQCLVEGCGWRGHVLSSHMNATHGVPADEFKRAAGFNKSTGVISAPLREELSEIPRNNAPGIAALAAYRDSGRKPKPPSPVALEGREHGRKARILVGEIGPLPIRVCRGCGIEFRQSTPYGRWRYCSPACRDAAYAKVLALPSDMLCVVCTSVFPANAAQRKRHSRGLPVVCGPQCRAVLNSKSKGASDGRVLRTSAHCPRGHEYTVGSTGRRRCRTCHAERVRSEDPEKRRARRRAWRAKTSVIAEASAIDAMVASRGKKRKKR